MALYIISMHVINSNSRTSQHWRLNLDEGKVQAAVADSESGHNHDPMDRGLGENNIDPVLNILTKKKTRNNGDWTVEMESVCTDCEKPKSATR